jgi:hypothetical protein
MLTSVSPPLSSFDRRDLLKCDIRATASDCLTLPRFHVHQTSFGAHPGYNSVGAAFVARMQAAGRNPGRSTVINFFNT